MKKEEAIQKMINDSAYQSPIEMIYHDIQMHFEDEVCKAVQQVDIHVDKEELIKALQYDREQFAKGYANAKAVAMQRQNEERENIITWLAKFCRHIDMPEHLSDEDAEILWREKMKQQFGWDQDMIQIEIERRPDAERMAYMQGYKAGIEKGHKDMLGYYPQTMTEDKLNEITSRVCDIFRHTEFYDCTFCDKGMGGDCIECEEEHTVYFLLDVIASLHNELYKQVKGKYYDYMFHWANLGYGGSPNDSIFKDWKEGEEDEHTENCDH